ncbi:LOW QUALITY PROTEIN: hypothetical protein GQ55_6G034200 [Panicum hallii var. hallii]|uniref:Uncharacterized protein n=1 Tax=Panicum hallii var. hallii TaxID=1504633 RepID=A0A2T7D3D8_9POAL|nr:LOW QUALITY PROTEIN: hypothetical protein GQ55_6G034200 [Panicum hallii var. hallii]
MLGSAGLAEPTRDPEHDTKTVDLIPRRRAMNFSLLQVRSDTVALAPSSTARPIARRAARIQYRWCRAVPVGTGTAARAPPRPRRRRRRPLAVLAPFRRRTRARIRTTPSGSTLAFSPAAPPLQLEPLPAPESAANATSTRSSSTSSAATRGPTPSPPPTPRCSSPRSDEAREQTKAARNPGERRAAVGGDGS